jgi:hypothetical protein
MDNACYTKLKSELNGLKDLKKNALRRIGSLEKYSNAVLRPYKVNGHTYYYANNFGGRSSKYLGNEANADVLGIKEYRYLKQLISDLDSEIHLTEMVLSEHVPIDYASVNSRLPAAYRNPGPISLDSASDRATHWKAKREAEKARHPVKHPEELIMTALDGTKLRSKSELTIANMFVTNGIPYVYELPHLVNGIWIYSDFTALSLIDFKSEIITEHEGLMKEKWYQEVLLKKINGYLAAGLIPGRDVFFTFDDLKGGFDSSPVQIIIDTKLKPRS